MKKIKTTLTIIAVILFFTSCSQSTDSYLKTSNCNYTFRHISTRDISIAEGERYLLDIAIPNGLDSAQVIELSKCQIKKIIQEKGLSSISMMMRLSEEENPVFNIDFAPSGKWDQVNKNADLEEYEISVKIWATHYFK